MREAAAGFYFVVSKNEIPREIMNWLQQNINGDPGQLIQAVYAGDVAEGNRKLRGSIRIPPKRFEVYCDSDFTEVIPYWADDKGMMFVTTLKLVDTRSHALANAMATLEDPEFNYCYG